MNNNQFFDFFKTYASQEQWMDFMKKFPTVDFATMSSIFKRNTEAFSEANHVVSEKMQNVFKKISEIYQDQASQAVNMLKNTMSTNNLEDAMNHQKEYFKNSLDNSVVHAKELIETTANASKQIFDVIGDKVSGNMHCMFKNKNKDE